ncbi:MAG: O-methyltransferase [Candidatus Dormibacteraeota bacterium]|nr:O-methyltransferase [Candidatus Dormibacteraeota bacterium]
MTEQTWTDVDTYITSRIPHNDDALDQALRDSLSLPNIQVTAPQGKLLHVLATAIGARRVLEVGTLGGYSAIWMARALPRDGMLLTLEVDAEHARIAQNNFRNAGVDGVVELRLGPALDTMRTLIDAGETPFDLVFIDADKPPVADYFDSAVRLSHPGSVIVVDNVVRDGRVIDGSTDDASVRGNRRLVDALGSDDRVTATVIQTVGGKGYDGFAIAVVSGG